MNSVSPTELESKYKHGFKKFGKFILFLILFLIFLEAVLWFVNGLPLPWLIGKNCTEHYVWRPSGVHIVHPNMFTSSTEWVSGTDFFDFFTFRAVDNNCEFTKDMFFVYFGGRIVQGANPYNFSAISKPGEGFFARDANSVYHGYTKIEGADPNTFVPLGGYYAKDKNRAYYILDPRTPVILSGVDVTSFGVVTGTGMDLAKDDKHFYYCGKQSGDSEGYKVINKNYIKNNKEILFFGEWCNFKVVTGANINSFEVIENPKDTQGRETTFPNTFNNLNTLAKDSNLFYYCGTQIASSKNFGVISNFYVKNEYDVFYVAGCNTTGLFGTDWNADPKSFVVSDPNYGYLARDKNFIYIGQRRLTFNGLDINSFEWLTNGYGKDKNRVYFLESMYDLENGFRVVPNKNPATFVVPNK